MSLEFDPILIRSNLGLQFRLVFDGQTVFVCFLDHFQLKNKTD
jgi:hypothetical protein